MPTIDRIKISQEINFNGMPTWIGIEGTLLPGEDEKDGLRQIQKSITEYQQEEAKAYGKSKWTKGEFQPDPESKPMMDMIVLKQYQKAILEKDEKTINQIKAQYHVED